MLDEKATRGRKTLGDPGKADDVKCANGLWHRKRILQRLERTPVVRQPQTDRKQSFYLHSTPSLQPPYNFRPPRGRLIPPICNKCIFKADGICLESGLNLGVEEAHPPHIQEAY
jgi:hypothetical protein